MYQSNVLNIACPFRDAVKNYLVDCFHQGGGGGTPQFRLKTGIIGPKNSRFCHFSYPLSGKKSTKLFWAGSLFLYFLLFKKCLKKLSAGIYGAVPGHWPLLTVKSDKNRTHGPQATRPIRNEDLISIFAKR